MNEKGLGYDAAGVCRTVEWFVYELSGDDVGDDRGADEPTGDCDGVEGKAGVFESSA